MKKTIYTTPVIVLATKTMGYGIIRLLKGRGIPIITVHYEKNEFGYLSRYIKTKLFSPHPLYNENEFLTFLQNLAQKFPGSLLIPSNDETLTLLSKNKDYLTKYFKVACNDWSVVEKIIEKKYTYELASSLNIPIPKTSFPHSLDEVDKFANDFEYPVIVKPVTSHTFSAKYKKKFFLANNNEELKKLFSESTDLGFQVMIQEIIPGEIILWLCIIHII